jgi:ferredoxin-NADP reductase
MAIETAVEQPAPVSSAGLLRMLVRQIRFEGKGINSYELVDPDGKLLPTFTAGAHVDVHLGDGLVRQYSLCNAPSERHRYVIAVLQDEKGRGGSKTLHQKLRVQDVIEISRPRNNFHLVDDAKKVILLAGGIGVTPLKSMAHKLDDMGADYELHYCARDRSCTAFGAELDALASRGRLRWHFDGGDPSAGMDIAGLLSDQPAGTHVYYCGPGGFMKACANASTHWPAGTVHFEHFKAPEPEVNQKAADDAAPATGGFSVRIASTGQAVSVLPDQSIVDALEAAGMVVATSCCAGLCGTCKVRYLSGTVEHNDYVLSEEEKPMYLTTCVSRATSEELVLDL